MTTKPNHLINQRSLYLLQHAYNPVDWYPWSEEAFQKAQKEDKPVFLSIGYSSCHWCHVMEKESFEDKDIAKFLNEHFVSIKVDREEHIDIDNFYMTFVQATSGSGGWPLNVFLLPDKTPFFGGTYFPPEPKYGKPSFKQVLLTIVDLYRTKRDEILSIKDKIINYMKARFEGEKVKSEIDFEKVRDSFEMIYSAYNWDKGGFGNAPKFPMFPVLNFCLDYYYSHNDERALNLVEHNLVKMLCGGIYDQVGGGLHRYSTDSNWIVPHFEKMLYDNAQLIGIIAKVLFQRKNLFLSSKLNEIIDFVINELKNSEGGFLSAIDADSEGEEGKFYVWNYEELLNALTENEFNLLAKYYSVNPDGNFEGKIILTLKEPFNDSFISSDENNDLRQILSKLRTLRGKRVHPIKDNKVLTDINSLLLSNLCLAFRATFDNKIYKLAQELGKFLLNNIYDENIFHSFVDGHKSIDGFAEDYFFLSDGLLSLYEITFDETLLIRSYEIFNKALEMFYDKHNRIVYQQRRSSDSIICTTDYYDNVLPSSTSMAIKLMLKFGKIFENSELMDESDKLLKKFFALTFDYPFGAGNILINVLNKTNSPVEIIFIEGEDNSSLIKLKNYFLSKYHPNQIVIFKGKGSTLDASFLKGKIAIKEKTTVYYCHDFHCESPVDEL